MSKKPWRFLKVRGPLFYKVLFLLAVLYVLSVLLNYNMTWMHPEVVNTHIPRVLEHGTRLYLEDLLVAFDCRHFDGPRSRFLSYLFQIFNLKFRLWLAGLIPPHPSLSLAWIFSLILSPLLLFKLICNMTFNRNTAWIGLSLYFLSSGFLSGVVMIQHPGKPLTNFFAVLCLYLASTIVRDIKKKKRLDAKIRTASLLLPAVLAREFTLLEADRFEFGRYCAAQFSRIWGYVKKGEYYASKIDGRFGILLGLLVIAYFSDETAWYILVCVPVIFPYVFKALRNKAVSLLLYISTFIVFLLFMAYIGPAINKHLGLRGYDFFGYAVDGNADLLGFDFGNILINARNLVFNQLVPWEMLPDGGGLILNSPVAHFKQNASWGEQSMPIYVVIIFGYFACLFVALPLKTKKIFVRTLVALFLFLVFQSLILTRTLQVVGSSYNYGNMLALFLTLPLAILLSVKKRPFGTLNKIILVLFLIISIHNFYKINYNWMSFQDPKYTMPQFFPKETRDMQPRGELTYSMVREAWSYRNSPGDLLALKKKFPRKSFWLFKEIEYLE